MTAGSDYRVLVLLTCICIGLNRSCVHKMLGNLGRPFAMQWDTKNEKKKKLVVNADIGFEPA